MKIYTTYTFTTPEGVRVEYGEADTPTIQAFTDGLRNFSGFAFHYPNRSAWYPAHALACVDVTTAKP